MVENPVILQVFADDISRLTRKLAPILKAPVPEMVCTVTYCGRDTRSVRHHSPSSTERGIEAGTPPNEHPEMRERDCFISPFAKPQTDWTLLTGSPKGILFSFQQPC